MWRSGNWQHENLDSAGAVHLRYEEPLAIGRPIEYATVRFAWCREWLFIVALAGPDHKLGFAGRGIFSPVGKPRAVGRPLREVTPVVVIRNWSVASCRRATGSRAMPPLPVRSRPG
jgi:hypothetical protein